jgi:hypothetical protein
MADNLIKQHRDYWEDADHLLKLAREYDAEGAGKAEDTYYLYWKFRLARMSFIARMMAVEALLNNVLEQFSVPARFRDLHLLAAQFASKDRFPRNRTKRRGHPFQIPLKWKMYLTPYLCNEDSRMQRDEYFHHDDGAYRKFRQLIMVRNEFVHARVAERDFQIDISSKLPIEKNDTLGMLLVNEEFSDCCKEMGIEQDPICFQVDNARVCTQAMREVVLDLNRFLGGRVLTHDFWEGETVSVGP